MSNEDVAYEIFAHPRLFDPLKALLPHDYKLPPEPTYDDMLPIIKSPAFINAIECLETALLETGLPVPLVKELGIPLEGGRDLEAFKSALNDLRPEHLDGGFTERERMPFDDDHDDDDNNENDCDGQDE
jgi:hypothetical protein